MGYDSVQECRNFSNNFNAPDDGQIGCNMLYNKCVMSGNTT